MYQYLHYSVPYFRRGPEEILNGNRLTRANLISTIASQPVGQDDSLLVYYTGHGENTSQGHVLNFPNGDNVLRSDIQQAMQQKGARLCVLLTDSCASGSEGPLAAPMMMADYNPPYWNHNICRYLFFRHTGFVSINSCSAGEVAVYQNPHESRQRVEDGDVAQHGGVFTTALINILTMNDGALRQDRMTDSNGRVTWTSIRHQLAEITNSRYTGIKDTLERKGIFTLSGQDAQTPAYLSLGTPVGNALPAQTQYRCGIRFTQGNRAARVTTVYDNTNASWYGLRVGDEIFRIQRCDEHFWRAFGMGAGDQFNITGTNDMQWVFWNDNDRQMRGLQPHVTEGMWIFDVRRNGNVERIPIRVPYPVNP
jgi:hypothetical protein